MKKKNILRISFAFAALICLPSCLSPEKSRLEEQKTQRLELAKKTRIVFNNDGCDAFKFPAHKKATPENLLNIRTTPLLKTDVTTISYCTISSGFGQFTHHTKVGEFLTKGNPNQSGRNIAPELVKQGTDPLKVMVDFARKNNLEIFWSMRMNDCHDSVHRPSKPYHRWSKLKENHPEYLVGSYKKRPKLAANRWTAVNYAHPEVRELAFRYIEEVCKNYDIDGIDLDFFRHFLLFKSVANGKYASTEELKMMTDFMKRVRNMTDKIGAKRGKPILILVRIPDSPDFCKASGVDLTNWLKKGLVDIVTGAGYFQLNPWSRLVKFGKKYNVPVYAGISESRVRGEHKWFRRGSYLAYRARAQSAWQAGVNGIYIFNEYNAKKNFLKEIGSPAKLNNFEKMYFPSYVDGNADAYLRNGSKFQNMFTLTPRNPAPVTLNKPCIIPFYLGDKLDKNTRVSCTIWIPEIGNANNVAIKINGKDIKKATYKSSWLSFKINNTILHTGKNIAQIKLKAIGPKQKKWDMTYNCEKKLKYPVQLPWRRLFRSKKSFEKIVNNTLYLGDCSKREDGINPLAYPWIVDGDKKIYVEAKLKVKWSSAPLGICIRIANGKHVEWLDFSRNKISLMLAGLEYKMNTTDKFHDYRVELEGKNIEVYVDGKLRINGKGKFITKATNTSYWYKFANGAPARWNKCSLMFGPGSGKGTGAAYWKGIRYHSSSRQIKDFVIRIKHKKTGSK